MRAIELRVGQVSSLLDTTLTGVELNALIGKGKSDYHCKYSPHDVRLARLKLKGTHLARKPFVIAVNSTHTGAGKTMVAANLGATFAWMGLRVLLIDGDSCGDLSRAVLSDIENKRQTHIASVMQGASLERAIIPIYADGMLDIVSSNVALSDADIEMSLQATSLNEFLGWFHRESQYLSETYDVIVVDTCSYPTRLTLNLLVGAQLILGVIGFRNSPVSDAAALKRGLEMIKETQGIPLASLLLVANGMQPADHQDANILMKLSEIYAGALCDVVIPKYAHKSACAFVGIIAEREPNSYAAQCFFELAKHIVRRYIQSAHTS